MTAIVFQVADVCVSFPDVDFGQEMTCYRHISVAAYILKGYSTAKVEFVRQSSMCSELLLHAHTHGYSIERDVVSRWLNCI